MASPPFKVKALFEYTSNHEDDLPFEVGQIITVTNDEDPDWYDGEYVDASGEKQEGIFPRNFVEKYEPTAPPRPTRPRKKEPEHAPPPPAPVEEVAEPEPEPESVQEAPAPASPPPPEEPRSPRAPAPPVPKPAEPVPVASPQVVPPSEPMSQTSLKAPATTRSGPPPVSQKPTSSSFKDRIAAFNKPAAPPIAPFKPSGFSSGNSGFIKKPFVAPPPSRNAYVPPPRDTPTAKIYRRDEDPEVKQREAENLESAEKAGLVPSGAQETQGGDQPKPTTLKERIALLQKQQAEQAQRHAEAAAKKEKPKRPAKKRTDSDEQHEGAAVEDTEAPPPLERRGTEPTEQPLPTRRKSYKETAEDGNEADMSGAGDTTEGQEDLTEREDSDERPKRLSRAPTGLEQAEAPQGENEEAEEEEEEEEEEEDVDPEVRRKEELRARMAKMSGGMGMMGLNMFGAPLPTTAPKKKKKAPERRASGHEEEPSSPHMTVQPIPAMMALPGMGQRKPKEEEEVAEAEEPESPTAEEITPVSTASPRAPAPEVRSRAPGSPPPVPGGRPAPPPVPAQSRPPPPPPPATADVASPSVGSESDDELSENPLRSPETPRGEPASATRAPPPVPMSPRLPGSKRTSYVAEDHPPSSPSVSSPQTKRYSRPPPPIPGVAPPAPSESRPPPPPPPGMAPSRTSTSDDRLTSPMRPGQLDNGEEGEVTEYEGDYDTDIASSVPHKEALKSHGRESSVEEDSAPVRSPVSDAPPPSFPPPIPTGAAPTAVRPPIPGQPAPSSRRSTDMPRAAPPPPPPPKEASYVPEDEEYDPYNYSTPQAAVPTAMSYSVTRHEEQESEPYDDESEPTYQSQHMPPLPPPPEHREPPPAPPVSKAPARQSIEGPRPSIGLRRSVDVGRPSVSMETGFMANDIDLAEHTNWWMQPNPLPPALQGRKDIFSEVAESTSQEGGKNLITKEICILFTDYSQTVITVRFDPQRPLDTQLEQRHEPPPRSLRQDELEQAYERFGTQIAGTVSSKKDSVVGDGSPQSLVHELLKPHKDALFPVGTRAYGALVYANLANASTTMNDEIRPGDIISIRNAKFQGKHGPMHAKYTMEVGKPDHVGVVSEWDGTKKKVRAWEQGRESKKVKQESFKLDDLRSGEIKIWRVMPRSWVGWDPSKH